jgi:hypothetical protein
MHLTLTHMPFSHDHHHLILQLFRRQLTDALGGAGSALVNSNSVAIVLAASAGSQLVSIAAISQSLYTTSIMSAWDWVRVISHSFWSSEYNRE